MTTARQLVSNHFVRIGQTHSTAEAVAIIFDPEPSTLREIVIVVLDAEGNYFGLVDPHEIFDSLGTSLSVAGDDPAAQIAAIRRSLATPVSEIARRNVPAARLDDGLATLLTIASHTESSTIPVFDGPAFVGVISTTTLFNAICKISLSTSGDDLPFLNADTRQ
jgi:hypothetical protein